ncbi:MAG: hypothetical protein NZ606_00230 [Candidatus Kapabacteria bacterium]|nr:hypothetical protein [Candidatus Kapabacteria bacterium]
MVRTWVTIGAVAVHVALAQDAFLEQVTGDALPTPDLDRIEYYSENRILLDSATSEEIARLPYISRALARRIAALARKGTLRSITELCDALECTEEQRYVLERCTQLSSASFVPIPITLRTRAMLWATPPRGAQDGRFRGNPHELYTRAMSRFGATTIAALTNKDAGEPLLADFVSLSVATRLGTTRAVVGDYFLEQGLGLVLWRPFGARKGTDVIGPVTEFGRGIEQYRSAVQYRFFRGVALEQPLVLSDSTQILLRAGLSALPRTATVDTNRQAITSLATDGYHRTSTELAKRYQITERAAVGAVEYQSATITVGVSLLALDYPLPVRSSSTLVMPAQRGIFSSIYVSSMVGSTVIAAELARDYAGAFAVRAGIEQRAQPMTVALGTRWYAPEFRAPYGYNFGESSQPTNEMGLYASIRIRLSPTVQILSYADMYRHVAAIGALPRLRRGVDFFTELRARFDRRTLLLVRIRQEHRSDDQSTEAGTVAEEILRTTLRCELQHTSESGLNVRFRVENGWRQPSERVVSSAEHGVAAFGELAVPLIATLRVGGRITAYTTASFNSAVYTFEQLAPGLLVSVPLYGAGTRSFVFVEWHITPRLTLWARYGSTERLNVSSLGSGPTEVPGTRDARAYIQLDIRL